MLEASGIDFAGSVVIPELPSMPVARTPAGPPSNIVFLMSYQIQFFMVRSPHRPTGRQ